MAAPPSVPPGLTCCGTSGRKPASPAQIRKELAQVREAGFAHSRGQKIAGAVEALERPDEEVRAVRWRLAAGAPLSVERSSAMAWAALAAFDVELVIAASEHALAGGNRGASIPLATGLAYAGRNEEAIPAFEVAVASARGEWPTAFARLASTLNRAYLDGWDTWVADAHRASARNRADPTDEVPERFSTTAGPEQRAIDSDAAAGKLGAQVQASAQLVFEALGGEGEDEEEGEERLNLIQLDASIPAGAKMC